MSSGEELQRTFGKEFRFTESFSCGKGVSEIRTGVLRRGSVSGNLDEGGGGQGEKPYCRGG